MPKDSLLHKSNGHTSRQVKLYGSLLFLFVFSILFRYVTSDVVETGGDAVYKWSLVKQFVLFGDVPLKFNHHSCRWAITIPLFFICKCFGVSPTVYYIWPFFTSTMSGVFCFLLVERIRSWRVGLAAGILIILSAPMLRQGTQLLPMGTAVFYLLASLYFLVRWRDNGSRWNVTAGAVLFFFAYGAKITIIYYFPAFFTLIYILGNDDNKKFTNSLLFLGVFIVGFVVETLLFNALTGVSFGRLELIQLSHHPIRTTNIALSSWQSQSDSLLQYIANFFVYFKYAKPAAAVLYYIAFVVSAVALVKKWRNTSVAAIPFLFGFIGHAYAITSVFPFHRPERMLDRYQTAIYELALLVIILFLSAPHFKKIAPKRMLLFSLGDQRVRLLLFCILAIPIVVYSGKHIHVDTGYITTSSTMEKVRRAEQEGLPVFVYLQRKSDLRDYRRNKLIVKFRALYTNIRYFGKTSWPTDPNIHLVDFPVIIRQGRPYQLVERNGFAGKLAGHGLFLDHY